MMPAQHTTMLVAYISVLSGLTGLPQQASRAPDSVNLATGNSQSKMSKSLCVLISRLGAGSQPSMSLVLPPLEMSTSPAAFQSSFASTKQSWIHSFGPSPCFDDTLTSSLLPWSRSCHVYWQHACMPLLWIQRCLACPSFVLAIGECQLPIVPKQAARASCTLTCLT